METIQKDKVKIDLGRIKLDGILTVPPSPKGIVVFSHGSGSSHLSPRNSYIAGKLNSHKFATLLFDLLTEGEDIQFKNRFDIELLTDRLLQVSEWLKDQAATIDLPLGFFGASTGAASALRASALMGEKVEAVVSKGGRPDMAGSVYLTKVTAPTLLLVGGKDDVVLSLNQKALHEMNCTKELKIIPGAGHLFAEPHTLERVAVLASLWFDKFLN
ncbi:hydrolase [Christiangramia fulva]|uniref:Hydrolase n=1 Tax=Christiangramia fulva TaxID=2126553 RepID=A0A2R3Z5S9_9FLAO|nr:dienelactone hydrolase family protein [Christiangramia fulva]AVR45574.1 hydrolase [Christiangramia fulva]